MENPAIYPPSETQTPFTSWLREPIRVNWETLFYALILCAALFTRFHILGARVMSHDESLHTYYSYVFFERGDFAHTPLMHGPLLFEANALFYALFGANDFTARIYPALLGVLLVMSPLLFRRWIGRHTALVASLLLLISPITMYYNRYIRHDTPVLFYALLLLWSAMMYLEGPSSQRGRSRWLYAMGLSLLLCFASKENTFIYVGIFGSFLTLYWLLRVAERYRSIPAQRYFHSLTLAILIGGFVAIMMTGILAIAFHGHNSVSGRIDASANGIVNWFSPEPVPLLEDGSVDQYLLNQQQSERLGFLSFLRWGGILGLATVGMLIGPALWVYRRFSIPWREVLGILIIAALVCGVLLVLESRSLEARPHEAPDTSAEGYHYPLHSFPFYAAWAVALVIILGVRYLKRRGFWEAMHAFPEFDVLIVLGTLTLPWLSAILITAMGPSFTYGEHVNASILTDIARAAVEAIRAVLPINFPGYDEATHSFAGNTHAWQVLLSLLPILPFFIVSAAVGLTWNWRRWLILATMYFGLYAVIFTSIFTNANGLGTGIVSSLGYWLGQQGVRRGSQPQYYYTGIILPLYEYLPIIGSFLATITGIGQYWRRRLCADHAKDPTSSENLTRLSWPLLFAWWGILAIFGYTLAGEKMPWLGIHMAFPLIMMSAWFFGRLFARFKWRELLSAGWIALLLIPGVVWGLWRLLGAILRGEGPFGGLSSSALRNTTLWLGALVLTLALIGFLFWLAYRERRRSNWRYIPQACALSSFIILCLMTMRTAFAASFVNHDYANEFLVYAHAAPQVKYVLGILGEMSERSENGPGMRFGYAGDGVSWPLEWYMRDYPNSSYFGVDPELHSLQQEDVLILGPNLHNSYGDLLSSEYIIQPYLRLWWPNQDYFNLKPERVNQLFNFSLDNQYSSDLRVGLMDIFWSRDFTKYFETVGRATDISDWDPAGHMYLYIRRDFAARVWTYEIGGLSALSSIVAEDKAICPLDDGQHIGSILFVDLSIEHPIGMVAAGENILIADEMTNQIRRYNASGQLLNTYGSYGDVYNPEDPQYQLSEPNGAPVLYRPNGVALAGDGGIYIADTWNYRIHLLSAAGEAQAIWGEQFPYGAGAPPEPVTGFWGPRDLVLDSAENVYVADTGNKRIRVYDAGGAHLHDIGMSGSLPGQLEEPGSLAIDRARGELYISEWWNQRVSIFSLTGDFLRSFKYPISGKREGIPAQIALDAERDLVYLSIPTQNRILVMNREGSCLASFGPSFTDQPYHFEGVTDITVDDAGNLLIADAGSKRIFRFPPYDSASLYAPNG